ncbi:hypothetical protein BGW38_000904, partial [Lunasporangiospora selenospora]
AGTKWKHVSGTAAGSGKRIDLIQQRRLLSTGSESVNTKPEQTRKKNTLSTTLNVRQRTSGSWRSQWQMLTFSSPAPSDPDQTTTCQIETTSKLPTPPLGPGSSSTEKEEEQQAQDGLRNWLSPQTTLAVFLPKGFPESVTTNYWPFAKWQFVHNVAGSVTAERSISWFWQDMAAALNWIIKDGLGQLGGVVYASFVSDKFDSEPKRFRFQATVAMQGANILELLTPLWPGSFLMIASISNIGKNMAWLASSATRAQMNKTFALRDNLGDITGKSGSQTTAAGLVGTGLGVIIAALMNYVSEDPTALPLVPMCLTFLPFSIFNIYSNYRSSQFVTTLSLNVPRAETVFYEALSELSKDRLKSKDQPSPAQETTSSDLESRLARVVPTPDFVAHDEVFVSAFQSPFKVGLEIEPAIGKFVSNERNDSQRVRAVEEALKQVNFKQQEQYYILVDQPMGAATERKTFDGKVVIWFDRKAKGSDVIQGFYHACSLRLKLEHGPGEQTSSSEKSGTEWGAWSGAMTQESHEEVLAVTPTLVRTMGAKGWDTESLFLTDGDGYRLQI